VRFASFSAFVRDETSAAALEEGGAVVSQTRLDSRRPLRQSGYWTAPLTASMRTDRIKIFGKNGFILFWTLMVQRVSSSHNMN